MYDIYKINKITSTIRSRYLMEDMFFEIQYVSMGFDGKIGKIVVNDGESLLRMET